MKRRWMVLSAVCCALASSGRATAQGRFEVVGSIDAPVRASLAVFELDEAWLVESRGVAPDAFLFLFLGLPNPDGGLFRVDLGFYGHVDLEIAYPSGPIPVSYPDVTGLVAITFARPNPIPPEVLGYVLAVQGVEAFFQTFQVEEKGALQTVSAYRPTDVATFTLK